MRQTSTDIWKAAGLLDYVVVPTAICVTKQGIAVLGRGIAKAAAGRHPDLAVEYGSVCAAYGTETPVTTMRLSGRYGSRNLVLFPVQPLNLDAPHLSWRQPADIALVRRSLGELRELLPTLKPDMALVFIPDVGCANGLTVGPVRELIEEFFGQEERVVHVKGAH